MSFLNELKRRNVLARRCSLRSRWVVAVAGFSDVGSCSPTA